MRNNKRYHIGNQFTVVYNLTPQFLVEIVSLKHFALLSITPAMSYLDTGYSPSEQIKLMETMYKNKNVDIYQIEWTFIVLMKIKPNA
jgi:hypothetical protein